MSLLAVVFAVGSFYFAGAALANATNEIKVEAWNGSTWELLCQSAGCADSKPLFQNTNFLPGDASGKKVRITNVDIPDEATGTQKEISIQAINVNNPFLGWAFLSDRFGDILNFKIIENGGAVKYEKTLSAFFGESGDVVIATIPNGESREFDFQVYFNEMGDDRYQGKSLGFDVVFGLRGEEAYAGNLPASSGTSVPGSLPHALIITDESTSSVDSDSALITWETSFKATSRVIYCKKSESCILDLGDNAESPPKYGYNYTTAETDTPANPNGVTYHKVELTGLESGTAYEYRAISHASPPSISRIGSFTTLKGKQVFAMNGNIQADENAEPVSSGDPGSPEKTENPDAESFVGGAPENQGQNDVGSVKGEETGENAISEERTKKDGDAGIQKNMADVGGAEDSGFDLYKTMAIFAAALILIGTILAGNSWRKKEL